MSGIIVGLVLKLAVTPKFTSEMKFTAVVYAEHAWPDGTHAYPAIQTVAGLTGYHERSVQRYVRGLEKLGVLIPDGKGPKGTNNFRFPFEERDGKSWLNINWGGAVSPRQPATGDTDSGDSDSGDTGVTRINQPDSLVVVVNSGTVTKKYEQEFGALTPLIADAILDDCDTYSAQWVDEAMDIAVLNNRRNWKYVQGILKNCKAKNIQPSLNKLEKPNGNSRPNSSNGKKPGTGADYSGRKKGQGQADAGTGNTGSGSQPANDPQAAERHRERWSGLRKQAKVPAVQ